MHGSEAVVGNRMRRTIYYEFRAAEQMLSEGPWDAEWVDERLRLLPLGLQQHATANPQAEQYKWHIVDSLRPESSGDTETELRVAHKTHTSGSYCSAGSVPS